jgi:hypothetical protein
MDSSETYYFVKEDLKSYTLDEIINFNSSFSVDLKSPRRTKIGFLFIYLDEHPELKNKMEEELKKDLKYYTVVDKTRTNGDEVCSLTLEKFKNPYFVTKNGRSYEKEAILDAIEHSIYKDRPLRLEDIYLTPEMVEGGGGLTLYPNQSLGSPDKQPIEIDPKMIVKNPFNINLVYEKNIVEFSDYLKNITPNENEMWDYKKLWAFYAGFRDLNKEWANDCVAIENLVVENQKFPNLHPKCDSGHIVFKNVLFRDCTIDVSACWCGFNIEACKFDNCTLIYPGNPVHIGGGKFKYDYVPNYGRRVTRSVMDDGCSIEINHGNCY